MKKYILTIIFSLFISTNIFCQFSYDFKISEQNTKAVKLSSVISQLKYIPLETKPECMLGEDIRVEISGDNIFVFDYDRLFRFNSEGKFLNAFGKQGKGPGEYNRLYDFKVNSLTREVYLFDSWGKKILIFEYGGTYKNTVTTEFSGDVLSILNNKTFIFNNVYYYRYTKGRPVYELATMELNGKKIKKFESAIDRSKNYGTLLYFPFFYEYDGNLMYKNPINDTVFYFPTPKTKKPYAVLNTHKDNVKDGHTNFKNGEYKYDNRTIMVVDVEETKNNVFVFYSKGTEAFCGMYDKRTGEYINTGTKMSAPEDIVKRAFTYTSGLINDIDGGFPFWPRWIQEDNIAIDYRHAYEFLYIDEYWFKSKTINNSSAKAELQRLVQKIDFEDNPVLIIGSIR